MDFSGVTGIYRPIFSIFAVCRMIPSQKTYRFLLYARLINLYDGPGTKLIYSMGIVFTATAGFFLFIRRRRGF